MMNASNLSSFSVTNTHSANTQRRQKSLSISCFSHTVSSAPFSTFTASRHAFANGDDRDTSFSSNLFFRSSSEPM